MISAVVFLTLSAVAILTVRKGTKNAKPKPKFVIELPVEERHRLSASAEFQGLTNKYGQPAELADTGIIEISDRELSELS